MMSADEDIRLVTYLSPGIPQALFEALADQVQCALGHERVLLRVESRVSGPQKGGECASFAEEADVAFMCAPSFIWCAICNRRPLNCSASCPCSTTKGTRGSPSTSVTSWCATTVRSTLSSSSKEARGRTTMRAR